MTATPETGAKDVSGGIVGKFGLKNVAAAITVGFQFGGSGQLSTR